jgi:perosamine synthetase
MLSMVPPAAAPISLNEILDGIGAVFDESAPDRLGEAFCEYLNVKYAFCASSGRAALVLILRAMAVQSDRDEVVIPAYTCFSVPSAIVSAGLKIRLADLNPNTLDFDHDVLSNLDWKKVLCVVPSNLFGLPSNLPDIAKVAGANGAGIIDDAAQSLGGGIGNKKSGSHGDAGLLSFGRGKVISTYEGGMVVTQSDGIAKRISGNTLTRKKGYRFPSITTLLKLIGYSLFLDPKVYWIPNCIPFLRLGESHFDPHFAIAGLSHLQAGIGRSVFRRLDSWNRIRLKNASILHDALSQSSGMVLPDPIKGSDPVYLRFPILVKSVEARKRILSELLSGGIGVSGAYPMGIHRIPGIESHIVNGQQGFPQADFVAASILTLPTHPMLSELELNRMIGIIRRCIG